MADVRQIWVLTTVASNNSYKNEIKPTTILDHRRTYSRTPMNRWIQTLSQTIFFSLSEGSTFEWRRQLIKQVLRSWNHNCGLIDKRQWQATPPSNFGFIGFFSAQPLVPSNWASADFNFFKHDANANFLNFFQNLVKKILGEIFIDRSTTAVLMIIALYIIFELFTIIC